MLFSFFAVHLPEQVASGWVALAVKRGRLLVLAARVENAFLKREEGERGSEILAYIGNGGALARW